ncbi:unnamed protein product [Anisakis simplex]|uniref:GLOBIN domain-containing protein n=1 Tax=Anisakis simplex TaxID=6269 RepID=A0A0M3K338_ANISI|nr:unnamed protein product [Anisakis simplex]
MMGNSHGTTTETQSSDQKRRRLAESRRLSAPSCRGRLAIMACSSNAAERRWKFLNSSNRIAMRSLEEGIDGDVQLTMKPLKDRARSLSPLKQLRTYSFRSTPSEESFLSDVQQYWIKRSWCSVIDRLRKENREFGFFVLKRVFDRAPHLKSAFLSHQQISLEELPPNHAIHRHLHILTKVIDLAVRSFYSFM